MKKILFTFTLVVLTISIYSQNRIGYYFIDRNYTDTAYIGVNDSLYGNWSTTIDGPINLYCNGKKCNGLVEEFYINGNPKQSGVYDNGSIVGRIQTYYENGERQHLGQVKNGRRFNQWTWYFPNGQTEVIHQYDSFGRIEIELSFHENGKIMEYQINKNDSACLKLKNTYYESGQISSRYFQPNCDNGNEIRHLRQYYNNGTLKIKGQYLNRNKNGNFDYYNNKGKIIKTEKYDNGKLIKTVINNG